MSDWRMRALVKSGAIPSHKDPEQVNGTLVYAGDIDAYLRSLPPGVSGRLPTPPS